MTIATLVETGCLPGPEERRVLREVAACPTWLVDPSTPAEAMDAIEALIAREGHGHIVDVSRESRPGLARIVPGEAS